jgi:hypothetical protein
VAVLFGKAWTKDQLLRRVGRLDQIAGIERSILQEGRGKGSEIIHFRTGGGLEYDISADRGLDISAAFFRGIPFGWRSANGETHPSYFEPQGHGFLRSFPGGLMTTCGTTYMGAACEDNGELLGLHGRYSHQPAYEVSTETRWVGDDLQFIVKGKIRETKIFGEKVELTREITSYLGKNAIKVTDRVENLSFQPVEHMMLYHCNFGFPLVGPEMKLSLPSKSVVSRDPGVPIHNYERFEPPTHGWDERVYYHEMEADKDGYVHVHLENGDLIVNNCPSLMQVRMSYKQDTLPRLVQWKMCGEGEYVLGLEPANCHVEGRAKARKTGELVWLEPGEIKEYEIQFDVALKSITDDSFSAKS